MRRRSNPTSRRHPSAGRALGTLAMVATVASLSVSCAADGSSAVADPDAPAASADASDPSPGSSGAVTSAPGTSENGSTDTPVAAPAALQFTAPVVGGGTLDLASFAGSTVLFWFWAPG